jgi:hypothetical protein
MIELGSSEANNAREMLFVIFGGLAVLITIVIGGLLWTIRDFHAKGRT